MKVPWFLFLVSPWRDPSTGRHLALNYFWPLRKHLVSEPALSGTREMKSTPVSLESAWSPPDDNSVDKAGGEPQPGAVGKASEQVGPGDEHCQVGTPHLVGCDKSTGTQVTVNSGSEFSSSY